MRIQKCCFRALAAKSSATCVFAFFRFSCANAREHGLCQSGAVVRIDLRMGAFRKLQRDNLLSYRVQVVCLRR